MTFYIPDGLDDNGVTIDMHLVDEEDFGRYKNAREMGSCSSGFIGKMNGYIKRYKNTFLATSGFVASTLFTTPTEAQMRQRRPDTVITGTAIPRPGPEPVRDPRAIPAEWRQFADGVDVRSSSFSLGFFYSRGIPFYDPFLHFPPIPGYIYGNLWHPMFFGPLYPPYGAIVQMQWDNISRPYPPIGAYWQRSFGVSRHEYMLPDSALAERLLEEYMKTRDALENERVDRARREAEERVRREYKKQAPPHVQQPQLPVQPEPTHREEKPKVNIPYAGNIDRVQYDVVATHFYNSGLFAQIRKLSDGDVNLFALDEGRTIAIKDGNDNYKTLLRIDISRYPRCMHRDTLLERMTSEILNGLQIDPDKLYAARAGIEIEIGTYPDACTNN